MLILGETKLAKKKKKKKKNYGANNPIKIWDVNVDNIIISKLAETKINFKYLIGYLDKVIRPLFFILLKMSEYVQTFKVKSKNDKLISFRKDDEKLLDKI